MIENQSDNIDIKENDVSNQDNAPEVTSSAEDKKIENDELSSEKTEEINTLTSLNRKCRNTSMTSITRSERTDGFTERIQSFLRPHF